MVELISICEQAARSAGRVLLNFRQSFATYEKGPGDLVTDADFAAQQVILNLVQQHFPDHGFVGEEKGVNIRPDAEFIWCVDPLDGTLNYVHGLPHFSVSIAVLRRGQPVAAIVLDPVLDECFSAVSGGGATLNGHPMQTSRVTKLKDAMVAVSLPVRATRGQHALEGVLDVLAACQGVRRMGSAALNLSYVAAGRFGAYWDTKSNAWDIAAGVLLVSEAGGVVTGLDGMPLDLRQPFPIAAGTAELHRELSQILDRKRGTT